MTVPFRIVIVGGGTAGWMCAAACSAKLDLSRYDVRLIESDEIGTVGVGEATLPQMKDFNDYLGIDEPEFMAATQASFKLGIEFVDWGSIGSRYIHPFGAFGRPIGEAEFFHYWLRARETAGPLSGYCLPIVAAQQNRFDFPAKDAADPKSAFSYAYHFDAFLYARYLRGWSEARGIKRVEGRIVDVAQHPERGDIASVTLASGEAIAADLFIDCSGFRGLLIEQTLETGIEDWSHWLPCDRAMAVPCDSAGELTPYTRSTAREAGWQWRIPLQHRTGNGYVYASHFLSDDEAASLLLSRLDGAAQAEPRGLRFKACKRRKAWNRNVIAMGLAGGFLEPLESTSIYLVQMAVAFLLTLMPGDPEIDPALAREYNRVMDVEYDRIRDFLILHYRATERDDAEIWRYVRAMAIPDSLTDKIERFRHRGHIREYRDGLFGPASWQAVFIGQGIEPVAQDAMADLMPEAALSERLAKLRSLIAETAVGMPKHADTIARFCPAGGSA
ncbi:tryptophan halogenase family protein [Sphingomonas sp. G-3-2-10]|uniref:tryptophan halogenase family protein n=1 Tax=Sphingomonas sp. G-3-2-10 TaxID=2728838 RepID=UPI00146B71C1|nr:tryptophan halogenase family protein [Sphingomonas sp. G-3-2-10]NML07855.1 tryptophan 7-halogenase [Sphingomonas sp. G-3-2-10]